MAYNKVIYRGKTLIDLTEDTVTAETLAVGATAHNAAGELIEGTFEGSGSGGSGNDVTMIAFRDETGMGLELQGVPLELSNTYYFPIRSDATEIPFSMDGLGDGEPYCVQSNNGIIECPEMGAANRRSYYLLVFDGSTEYIFTGTEAN